MRTSTRKKYRTALGLMRKVHPCGEYLLIMRQYARVSGDICLYNAIKTVYPPKKEFTGWKNKEREKKFTWAQLGNNGDLPF